jgi:predicted RNA-binding Zn-ribbon protein involved in translation (DUF1610 family)
VWRFHTARDQAALQHRYRNNRRRQTSSLARLSTATSGDPFRYYMHRLPLNPSLLGPLCSACNLPNIVSTSPSRGSSSLVSRHQSTKRNSNLKREARRARSEKSFQHLEIYRTWWKTSLRMQDDNPQWPVATYSKVEGIYYKSRPHDCVLNAFQLLLKIEVSDPSIARSVPKRTLESPTLHHHLNSHTSELKYECPDCEDKFVWRSDLSRHGKTKHGTKRHFSGRCGKLSPEKLPSKSIKRHRVHALNNFVETSPQPVVKAITVYQRRALVVQAQKLQPLDPLRTISTSVKLQRNSPLSICLIKAPTYYSSLPLTNPTKSAKTWWIVSPSLF